MKNKRHTPEEIIKKLREAAMLLAGGQSVEEDCKKLEVKPADLSPLEGAIRRGERGDGEAAQASGKGERAAQEARGRPGPGHFAAERTYP
jgi:hypothetical protein